MDNKALLEKLVTKVKILESHIKRLKDKPESLHELDVEIMGEKTKEIYTLIHNLLPEEEFEESSEVEVRNSEVDKVPMVEVKPEPDIPTPKAPKMSSESEARSSDVEEEPAPNTDEKAPSTDHRTPGPEPQASDPQPPTPSPQPPEPEPIPAPRKPLTTSPEPQPVDTEPTKTTADLFSGPKTIADTFQAKEDKSIAATVTPQPAQDLKMAIGINDKFLFINELFQGDPSVYNHAIENMNSAGGLVQAMSSLDSYRAEYKWADNSEAYHRLKKILNAKYNG
jgi:hypothetical protein